MGVLTWIITNPRTFASIILALGLMAGVGYVVHRLDAGEIAVKQGVIEDRDHTIDTLNRNAGTMKAAKDASDAALKDLQAAHDQADAAARAAQASVDRLTALNDDLEKDLLNAPLTDKACFPVALGRLFNGVYAPAAAAGGGRAGAGGGEGAIAAGVPRQAAPVAGGAAQPRRPVVTIRPAQ